MFALPIAPDGLPPQRYFERFFFVQKYCFAAIGIDPTSLERTVYNPLRTWVPLVSIVTVCGPTFLFASKFTHDFGQMAYILSPMLQSILAIAKLTLFMWHKKKIVQLLRKVWLWILEANQEEREIIAEELKYDAQVSGFYYVCVIVSGFMAILLPFIIASFYAIKGNNFWEFLDPPFKGDYPIDPQKTYFGFAFALIWDVFGIYGVVFATLAIDTLFSWFMRNISAQFRILTLRFKILAENNTRRQTQGIHSERDFLKSITECVKYHQRVIQLAENFNEVYKHLVFIKFMISCVEIAFVTFQFSNNKQIAILILNVSFMISISTQLMLYCHGGQKIKDMSMSLDTVIYENFEWYNLSVRSQKLLLLPLMRSQKPCYLSGVLFIADFSLYLWVFKSAGSFLTMLMSVYQA